jgi:hypothetical protein
MSEAELTIQAAGQREVFAREVSGARQRTRTGGFRQAGASLRTDYLVPPSPRPHQVPALRAHIAQHRCQSLAWALAALSPW